MKYKKKNPADLYNQGGSLTQYEGLLHSQGGIPIDAQNEVETGETRGLPNTTTKDYIFSEQLLIPGKKSSFAKESKKIENKYSKRANDKLSNEQKERELNSLMNSQEQVRSTILDKTIKRAFGGDLSKAGQFFANYGRGVADAALGTVGMSNVVPDEAYRGAGAEFMNTAGSAVGSIGKFALPMVANAFLPGSGAAIRGAQMVGSQFNPEEEQLNALGGAQQMAKGGNLNFKSPAAYKAWLAYGHASGEFAKTPGNQKVSIQGEPKKVEHAYGGKMGKRYYQGDGPFPNYLQPGPLANPIDGQIPFTQEDLDALTFGSGESRNQQIQFQSNQNALGAVNQTRQDNTNKVIPQNTNNLGQPYQEPFNMINPVGTFPSPQPQITGKGADMSKINSRTSYTNPQQEIQDINKQYGSQPNNFNPNSLYNIGNFIGPAVDIYNSLKGPADVNYERVTPNLVDYTKSRDLTREDIQTGFRSTKDILKGVNSPGKYLNLTMQAAGQRDKATSDAIARSVEAERNVNANIMNQMAQFNAQTQRAEADARQQEIDQAKNVGRTGAYNLGTAIASTGRDAQARISQDEAKRFIGSIDYSPIKDKTGKITGYRHKGSNKIYIIE